MTMSRVQAKTPLRVALYARVSSEQQAEARTIASQVADLKQRIAHDGCTLEDDACFLDDGVSGTTLLRPALERLRDHVANGAIDRLYVHSPDRLARKYAYQALLVDEFVRGGVEVVFLNHALGQSAEDDLLLQVQGVIAEYERTKIAERSRRGKLHGARQGSVNVLSAAPYGYRYVTAQEGGGQARYQVILEEARVVRQIFAWVGQEAVSLAEVRGRLEKQGVLTRTGRSRWNNAALAYLLKNPAYKGQAGFGKSRLVERQARLRPRRGKPEVPRRPYSVMRHGTAPISIPVPALVSDELFAAAAERLAANRQRYRQSRSGASFLLQGLLVCPTCGYACCGQPRYHKKGGAAAAAQNTTGKRAAAGHRSGSYRCAGRMRKPTDDASRCTNPPIDVSELDEVVWRDVCQLLREPAKIEAEYERRLRGQEGVTPLGHNVTARIGQLKRGIARLIDAYSEGLLEKEEFEPKIRASKERLARLESEAAQLANEGVQRAELRLVIGKLQEFTARLDQGLEHADWATRREIIRALVKQIEVSADQIRLIYRVNAVPFVKGPSGGIAQDCWKRADTFYASLEKWTDLGHFEHQKQIYLGPKIRPPGTLSPNISRRSGWWVRSLSSTLSM
jgi:site-specific DNA recombinase